MIEDEIIELTLDEYNHEISKFERLIDEVKFILEELIEEANTKVHSIQTRIKGYDSIIDKQQRLSVNNPVKEMNDIAGIRIICLFPSDIVILKKKISDKLIVLKEENKIESGNVDQFGYISHHLICMLDDGYKGPRYDGLKNSKIEIQLRTISQHAWAEISHILEYKKREDIPEELKKDFYALSGLFYVADTYFEMIYNEKQAIKVETKEQYEMEALNGISLNLDSLKSYLSLAYPNRKVGSGTDYSQLLLELLKDGYKTIEDVDDLVNEYGDIFSIYEKKYHNNGSKNDTIYFTIIGVIRVMNQLKNYREIPIINDFYQSQEYSDYMGEYIVSFFDPLL
jgi:ppGpp synthetase/RelA/SpoT-type nucleotidyltranferase